MKHTPMSLTSYTSPTTMPPPAHKNSRIQTKVSIISHNNSNSPTTTRSIARVSTRKLLIRPNIKYICVRTFRGTYSKNLQQYHRRVRVYYELKFSVRTYEACCVTSVYSRTSISHQNLQTSRSNRRFIVWDT
jgi:hypothetical protein